MPKFAKQLLVFAFVTFAWIFFRAESLSDAWLIVSRTLTTGWADPRFPLLALALTLSLWCCQFVYGSKARRIVELAPVRVGIAVFMILYMSIFTSSSVQPFIYFQF